MRRPPGHGSITKDRNGWRVRVKGPGGRPMGGTFATEAEAEDVRVSLVAKMQAAGIAPTGWLTLAQWAVTYFDEREKAGFRGVDGDRGMWRVRVAPTFIAALPLLTVTRAHCREWIELTKSTPVLRVVRDGRTINTGKPPEISSVRRMRAVLRSVLQGAVDRGLVPANPCSEIVIRSPSQAPRWTYLSKAEVDHVITHDLIPARFRWMYAVAIYTGMRRGELWGLRWADVTLDGTSPQVYVRASHGGPTKTGKHRVVPLFAPAVEALRRIREIARDPSPEAYVFATSTGARRHEGDRGQWGRNGPHPGYRVVAGFTRKVPFHAFRHTCASALLQGYWGEPWTMTDVRDMLGHSSLVVTQRYAHLSTEHLAKQARGIRVNDAAGGTAADSAAAAEFRGSSIRSGGIGVSAANSAGNDGIRVTRAAHHLALSVTESIRTADPAALALVQVLAAMVGADAIEGKFWRARALDLTEAILSADVSAQEASPCLNHS